MKLFRKGLPVLAVPIAVLAAQIQAQEMPAYEVDRSMLSEKYKGKSGYGLYADGMTTLDYERGKASSILAEPWQTDDSIGSWGYNENTPYTTTDAVFDKIIDIVSKNGCLLLNFGPRADGTIPADALISDVMPLSETAAAVERLDSGENVVKLLIDCQS